MTTARRSATLATLLGLIAACHDRARPAGRDGGPGDAAADPARALDRACLARDLDACRSLGVLYAQGRGVPRDDRRAAALFGVACEGGDAAACNNLGLMVAADPGDAGVPDASAEAERLYQRACDDGSALGCRNLGLLLSHRDPPEDDRAAAAFATACDAGLPPACTNLGLLSSGAHDDDRAVTLFQRACEAGDGVGCRYVGIAYLVGRGLPRGVAPARVWLDRACAGGDGGGCLVLASVTPDASKAEALRARACTLGFREACEPSAPH